jgi:hypothetical protein
MKKVWEKPKVIVLSRCRDEEVLLMCKRPVSGIDNSAYYEGCEKYNCSGCNSLGIS